MKLTASQLRTIVFLTLAIAVFIDQVFIAKEAQPILIFLFLFLLGAIPAFQTDQKQGVSAFARFVMGMLGVSLSEGPGPVDDPDGTDSLKDTPTSSASADSASQAESSHK